MYTRLLKLNGKEPFSGYVFIYVSYAILTNCGALLFLLLLSLLDLFLHTYFFTVFLCVLAIMVSVAAEEAYHITAAVVLGKAAAIQGVVIRSLYIHHFPLMCINASVRFTKSSLSSEEHAFIAFGGAFCSLLTSLLLTALAAFLWQPGFTPVVICLFITPVTSLIPSKIGPFVSDGSIVIRSVHNKEQCKRLFKLIGQIFLHVLKPTPAI